MIGNGAFGKSSVLLNAFVGYVFKAIDCKTGEPVAIKRSQKVGNKVSREFEVLSQLKDKQNVIQLIDFFYSLDTKERLIQNSVFEFCDKNLEDVLKECDSNNTYLSMDDIKRYTKEILNGLHNMHQLRIVHRDLKPENILIKKNIVKICDFGSSKFIDEKPGSYKNTPYVVSRYYRAPELIMATNKYNEAIDIWAVGCILFELITRTPLFPGDTEGLQILEQCCVLGTPTDSDIQKLKLIVEDKVLSIFKKTQTQPELPLSYLFNKEKHGELAVLQAEDLIKKMLRWVPSERITALDAMNHVFLKDTAINIEKQ